MQIAGYINGKFVAGEGATLRIENPSDEGEVACFPGLSLEQFGAAVSAARQVFNDGQWSQRPLQERAQILHRFVDAMESRAAAIKDVLVAETGCPAHSGSMQAQFATPIRMAHEIIDFMAGLPETQVHPLPAAETQNRLGQKVQSLRSYAPLGVVVGISAYNFPLHTGVWKVMPALIAGDCVILRPNPLTPLSSMAFAQAAEAVGLPPGVINVVLEAGIEGAQLLTSDPLVDMITFTGSSAVGAQVAVQAAATFKRVQLEFGGKCGTDISARCCAESGGGSDHYLHLACRTGLHAWHSALRAAGMQGASVAQAAALVGALKTRAFN